MKFEEEDAVWCLVMFDLPVKTRDQQRRANAFRNLLLDLGLSRVQLSVYTQYRPKVRMCADTVAQIRRNLPPQGQVRVLYLSDTQWAKALYFVNETECHPEGAPLQMTIF